MDARAEKMAFPEEELARESVLPKFDVPNSVRNRNVVVDGKFEVGGFLGSVTDEAVYNQNQYGLIATYHINEQHGVNLSYGMMGAGVGTYAKNLNDTVQLDLSKTFGPKAFMMANYQFTGFYGKLSILKNFVVNTHIYGLAGLGTVMYEGLSSMALDFGLGQRFYILKNLALRFDLKFVRYTGPNPITNKELKDELAAGTLKIGDFETTNYFSTHLTGGLVFLF
jgi:outer membrane beta-barrel protein